MISSHTTNIFSIYELTLPKQSIDYSVLPTPAFWFVEFLHKPFITFTLVTSTCIDTGVAIAYITWHALVSVWRELIGFNVVSMLFQCCLAGDYLERKIINITAEFVTYRETDKSDSLFVWLFVCLVNLLFARHGTEHCDSLSGDQTTGNEVTPILLLRNTVGSLEGAYAL